MIVFWAYDQYPYCLSAKLKEVLPDGLVKVEGYGNYTFRPIIMLPDETGGPLVAELGRLRKEYAEKQVKLGDEYRAKAAELAPWLGIKG
jgi:hypothetical protein